jgi:hypothetical protein
VVSSSPAAVAAAGQGEWDIQASLSCAHITPSNLMTMLLVAPPASATTASTTPAASASAGQRGGSRLTSDEIDVLKRSSIINGRVWRKGMHQWTQIAALPSDFKRSVTCSVKRSVTRRIQPNKLSKNIKAERMVISTCLDDLSGLKDGGSLLLTIVEGWDLSRGAISSLINACKDIFDLESLIRSVTPEHVQVFQNDGWEMRIGYVPIPLNPIFTSLFLIQIPSEFNKVPCMQYHYFLFKLFPNAILRK